MNRVVEEVVDAAITLLNWMQLVERGIFFLNRDEAADLIIVPCASNIRVDSSALQI